jgi:hypothetical protein
MRFERGEVIFSRSALMGAESHACFVELGEGFGDRLDTSVIQDLVRRGIQWDVNVDSEEDPFVSRFYIVKR